VFRRPLCCYLVPLAPYGLGTPLEASALRHAPRVPALTGLSPHLRLQSDERLIALVRRGHHGAFEALLKRYEPRLLAFCRHMLGSNEDAEDVLQEVFASAYNAICADERAINARPWLYRIARNRCLNHLRRPQDAGQESMDVFERESGATAADTVHRREEFRQIVADVHELPETQRTALLLREIDTLSYEQIADAMDTTVPSVKSLLVRARMSLAEASEARQLTCGEVRLQLTQAAEGIAKPSPPTRRHVRSCQRCRSFRRELRRTSHVLAAVSPVGPLVALKAVMGGGTAGAGKGAAGAGGSTVAGGALAGSSGAGVLSFAGASIVTKTAAGLLTAALVTAGAAKVGSGEADERDRVSPKAAPATVTAEDRAHRAAPAELADGHARDWPPPRASAQPAGAGGRREAPVAHNPAAAGQVATADPVVEPQAPVEPAPVEEPPVTEEPYPPTTTPPAQDDGTYTGEGGEPTAPGGGGEDTGGGFPTVSPAPSGSGGEEEPMANPSPPRAGSAGTPPPVGG
jgi:RNA polymerase sigma factor (sigma-70 family)